MHVLEVSEALAFLNIYSVTRGDDLTLKLESKSFRHQTTSHRVYVDGGAEGNP